MDSQETFNNGVIHRWPPSTLFMAWYIIYILNGPRKQQQKCSCKLLKSEMHELSHTIICLAINKPKCQNVYFMYGSEQETITKCCNQVACTPASIQEASGSNLSPQTDYPDQRFSWFSSTPPAKRQKITSFHTISR
jgi:hypothetical protein